MHVRDVMIRRALGDDPVSGRDTVVETVRSVNQPSSDDTYFEVLSGDAHDAARFRLQVGDAAVHGIFLVLLDADGKIAEVDIYYRTLPAGVALQRAMTNALGWERWELRTNDDQSKSNVNRRRFRCTKR